MSQNKLLSTHTGTITMKLLREHAHKIYCILHAEIDSCKCVTEGGNASTGM